MGSVSLLDVPPESCEFVLFGVLSSEMVDCQCSGEIFELSELIVAIVLGIFSVDFLEGLDAFFYFGDFF